MNRREQIMTAIRRFAAVCFAISFLMAIVVFTDFGRSLDLVQYPTAKFIFIAGGAIGLVLNLITFQSGKYHPIYNFLYWAGSIVLFVGLVFLLLKWSFANYIVIAGLIVLGSSFVIPAQFIEKTPEDSELLDN